MTEAERYVKRDAVLGGRLERFENVPERYKVTKKSGLDGVENGGELGLFEIGAGDEKWTRAYRTRQMDWKRSL